MPVINTNVINSAADERDRTRANAQGINQAFQGLTNTIMDAARFGEQKRQFNKINDLKVKTAVIQNQYKGNWKQAAQRDPNLVRSVFQGLVPDEQLDNLVTGIAEGPETVSQSLERGVQGLFSNDIVKQVMEDQQAGQGQQVSFTPAGQTKGGEVTQEGGFSVGMNPQEASLRAQMPKNYSPPQPVGPTGPQPSPGADWAKGPLERGDEGNNPSRFGMQYPGPQPTPGAGNEPTERFMGSRFIRQQDSQSESGRGSTSYVPSGQMKRPEDVLTEAFTRDTQEAAQLMEQGMKDYEAIDTAMGFKEAGIENVPSQTDILRNMKPGEDKSIEDVYKRTYSEDEWNKLQKFAEDKGYGSVDNLFAARQQFFANVEGGQDSSALDFEREFSITKEFTKSKEAQDLFNVDLSKEQRADLAFEVLSTDNKTDARVVAKAIEGQPLTAKETKIVERFSKKASGTPEQNERYMYKAVTKGYEPYANALNVMKEHGVPNVPGLLTGMLQEKAKIDQGWATIENDREKLDLMRQELAQNLASANADRQMMGQMMLTEVFKTFYEAIPEGRQKAVEKLLTTAGNIYTDVYNKAGNANDAKVQMLRLMEEDSPYAVVFQNLNSLMSDMTGWEESSQLMEMSLGLIGGFKKGKATVPTLKEGASYSDWLTNMAMNYAGQLGGGGPAYEPPAQTAQEQPEESGINTDDVGNVEQEYADLPK